jgi:hypothetical protein
MPVLLGGLVREMQEQAIYNYLFIYLFLGPFRNSLPRVRDPMHNGAQTCEVPGMGPLPYREPILVS